MLTVEDRALLTAIMDTTEPDALARLLFSYYHDNDRANRTSREQMYLHMGMLVGALTRVCEKRPADFELTRELDSPGTVSGGDTREKAD